MAIVAIAALALICAVLAVACGCLVYMVRELHADIDLVSRTLIQALNRDELPPPGSEPRP